MEALKAALPAHSGRATPKMNAEIESAIGKYVRNLILSLLEPGVPVTSFVDACELLRPDDLLSVVTERNIVNLCASPICAKHIYQTTIKDDSNESTCTVTDVPAAGSETGSKRRLADIPTLELVEAAKHPAREAQFQPIHDRKYYCSQQCLRTSRYVFEQLSLMPVIQRVKNNERVRVLLSSSPAEISAARTSKIEKTLSDAGNDSVLSTRESDAAGAIESKAEEAEAAFEAGFDRVLPSKAPLRQKLPPAIPPILASYGIKSVEDVMKAQALIKPVVFRESKSGEAGRERFRASDIEGHKSRLPVTTTEKSPAHTKNSTILSPDAIKSSTVTTKAAVGEPSVRAQHEERRLEARLSGRPSNFDPTLKQQNTQQTAANQMNVLDYENTAEDEDDDDDDDGLFIGDFIGRRKGVATAAAKMHKTQKCNTSKAQTNTFVSPSSDAVSSTVSHGKPSDGVAAPVPSTMPASAQMPVTSVSATTAAPSTVSVHTAAKTQYDIAHLSNDRVDADDDDGDDEDDADELMHKYVQEDEDEDDWLGSDDEDDEELESAVGGIWLHEGIRIAYDSGEKASGYEHAMRAVLGEGKTDEMVATQQALQTAATQYDARRPLPADAASMMGFGSIVAIGVGYDKEAPEDNHAEDHGEPTSQGGVPSSSFDHNGDDDGDERVVESLSLLKAMGASTCAIMQTAFTQWWQYETRDHLKSGRTLPKKDASTLPVFLVKREDVLLGFLQKSFEWWASFVQSARAIEGGYDASSPHEADTASAKVFKSEPGKGWSPVPGCKIQGDLDAPLWRFLLAREWEPKLAALVRTLDVRKPLLALDSFMWHIVAFVIACSFFCHASGLAEPSIDTDAISAAYHTIFRAALENDATLKPTMSKESLPSPYELSMLLHIFGNGPDVTPVSRSSSGKPGAAGTDGSKRPSARKPDPDLAEAELAMVRAAKRAGLFKS